MSEQQPPDSGPVDVYTVSSVDVLRALADPTRQSILSVLMDRRDDLPVLSVKELAASIGEPQTKLYRHIKQLEAAGLIRVASTRLVSGIVEQRYQANQRDLMLDGKFLREHADDAETAMQAVLDNFRNDFFKAFRDKRLSPDAVPMPEPYERPSMFSNQTRCSRADAARIRQRIEDLGNWLAHEIAHDPDGMLIDVLIGYYAPQPAEGQGDAGGE